MPAKICYNEKTSAAVEKQNEAGESPLSKITGATNIGKYTVLFVDKVSDKSWTKFLIDGKEYEPISVYDLPNSVAVAEKGDFVGKEILFI